MKILIFVWITASMIMPIIFLNKKMNNDVSDKDD